MVITNSKIDFSTLARELKIEPKKLAYVIYVLPDNKKYTSFQIPKKSGGVRTISKPVSQLLNIQRNFKDFLLSFYTPKPCSHGFEKERNIKTNALKHLKSKILLNIDIKDFFGSINFGRVYGLLSSKPFNFDKQAAAAGAKLVTFQNKLPQGAPTSPVISNMIARRLDGSLTSLALRNKSIYTRYVDDITISTTHLSLDKSIVKSGKLDDVIVGDELKKIIEKEGFEINQNKTRQLNNFVRKEVTGITINEFPNVKRTYINSIFGMIHSWKKFGYANASLNYSTKYLKIPPKGKPNLGLYRSVIIGKIGFVAHVRGWDDVVVSKLCRKYCECDSNPPKRIQTVGGLSLEFDVFLGHASEQKETVAKPLYDSLVKLGMRPFIDVVEIKWGDSLTKLINKGLSEAEYFVAIISINSIKKSWPDTEMNAAIARQINGKQKVLPLFVGTREEIEKCKSHYSLISDKLYKVWDNNPDQIAQEINGLFQSSAPPQQPASESVWEKIRSLFVNWFS